MSAHSQKSLSFLRSIIIIRLINAFWVTTFFQPDEFFQVLEPAWDLAFGPDSGAWLTWVRFLFFSLPIPMNRHKCYKMNIQVRALQYAILTWF